MLKTYKKPVIQYIECTISRYHEKKYLLLFKRIPFDDAVESMHQFLQSLPQRKIKGGRVKIVLQTVHEGYRIGKETEVFHIDGYTSYELSEIFKKCLN